AGRHGARELVADGMAALVLRDGRVVRQRESRVSGRGPRSGVEGVAVVGVDDVTGAAAGGAEVARMVVRATERQVRSVEARLMEVDEGGADAEARAASAVAELDVGASGLILAVRITDLGRL